MEDLPFLLFLYSKDRKEELLGKGEGDSALTG